jgi:hypothetical protein
MSALPVQAGARARHVAWAKQRLKSDWGKAQLRANLQAGFKAMMAAPVGRLFQIDSLSRLVEHLSTEPVLSRSLRPLVRASVMLELARLREDPDKLGVYVSDEARALIEKLLERPGMMPEKFATTLLTHPAFEQIARDVLDDALKEFSEKVDPFRAEWGLPSLLKMGGPIAIGLGMFGKGIDAVRDEFEKRLEPERKRFLQAFARRALTMVADFIIKRNDEPPFVALRKEVFAWLLEQPVSELMATASPAVSDLTEQIGHAISRHVSALPATRRRRRAQIELIYRAHENQPLAQALAVYGASFEPDFDAIIEVVWPLLAPALETPEVDAFFDQLVGGFYDLPEP